MFCYTDRFAQNLFDMRMYLSLILLLSFSNLITAQSESNDIRLAEKYFLEIQAKAVEEGGKLWGINLYGPLLFADADRRIIYANERDSMGLLTPNGNIYTGNMPAGFQAANTAIDWAGKKWTMVFWPLSTDSIRRSRLIFHEFFHSRQDQLGLPAFNSMCNHLDTRDGRIYLRLELQALKSALGKAVDQRKNDLENALLFRSMRQELFPGADTLENSLEFNEGMAEYTGVQISGINGPDNRYLRRLADSAHIFYPTFTRSLGYITGPVYGKLLQDKSEKWHLNLMGKKDFAELIKRYYSIPLPENKNSAFASLPLHAYNRDKIFQQENEKEEKTLAQLKIYQQKLIDGPILTLPLTDKMHYTFDPNKVIGFKENETIYLTVTMDDIWGRIDVTDGALIKNKNQQTMVVSLYDLQNPGTGTIKTAGWTLIINAGWSLVSDEKKGNWILKLK